MLSTLPTSTSTLSTSTKPNLRDVKPSPRISSEATFATQMLLYTNPWPLHDELTEHAETVVGRDNFLLVEYYGYHYWCRGESINNNIGKATGGEIGNYSIYSSAGWQYYHLLFFCFSDTENDVSQWNYIKYYQALLPYGNTGYAQFGFFCYDPRDYSITYWATVSYMVQPDGYFHPKQFDIWGGSPWSIDPGFDWHRVSGFAFAAEIDVEPYHPPALMYIDSPMLHSGSEEIPYGDIDWKWVESDAVKWCAVLKHCGPESIPTHDQWALHFTVTNKWRTRDKPVLALAYVKLTCVVDDVAMVFPDTYEPKPGTYGWEEIISWAIPEMPVLPPLTLTLPKLRIDFNTYIKNGLYYMEWTCKDPQLGGLLMGNNVIENTNDFVVPFIAPQGFKPIVHVRLETEWWEQRVNWYRDPYTGHSFFIVTWNKYYNEEHWLSVDPPEAIPINPEPISPVNHGVTNDIFTQRGGYGMHNNSRSFRPGSTMIAVKYVMDNGYPVNMKDVGLEIQRNEVCVAKLTARTNENGTAIFVYNLTGEIGSIWDLYATVDVRATVYMDTLRFLMGHGDLNGDIKVDMKDIAIVAKAFGSSPEHPLWNPIADITGIDGIPDDKVDMRDVAAVAKEFGNPQ